MKCTFAHNNLNVLNLEKSLAFYEKALGLHVVRKKETPDFTLCFLSDGTTPHMLELTAKGADKGAMLLRLGRQFGVRREDLCAVGDHRNDLPMLKAAGRAFAPANAVAEVRALPGITVVRSAESHALQDVVARLAHERH